VETDLTFVSPAPQRLHQFRSRKNNAGERVHHQLLSNLMMVIDQDVLGTGL